MSPPKPYAHPWYFLHAPQDYLTATEWGKLHGITSSSRASELLHRGIVEYIRIGIYRFVHKDAQPRWNPAERKLKKDLPARIPPPKAVIKRKLRKPRETEVLMPKKVLIALPPAMLEHVDMVAGIEHRTRSDLIREALRRYLDGFASKHRKESPVIPPPARPSYGQWQGGDDGH